MPACKTEAHRALELLEDYYSRIGIDGDQELKLAIERVIKIFKSRLFQALLDIQELYEMTLLDNTKSIEVKREEAVRMANRWESSSQRPFPDKVDGGDHHHRQENGHHNSQPLSGIADLSLTSTSSQSRTLPGHTQYQQTSPLQYDTQSQMAAVDNYIHEEIVLERGTYGLGFSITGGTDNPHSNFVAPEHDSSTGSKSDTSIYITKIIPGGAAAMDKRLQVNDIILQVNDVPTVDVAHSVAVDALKKAGNRVVFRVKRRKPHTIPIVRANDMLIVVELNKSSKGLGFTIAGGVGNQHIPGDNGIYVTKIMKGGAAAMNANIDVGDRLVCIQNHPDGEYYLDNCSHEEAVSALKRCRDVVRLQISKAMVANFAGIQTQPGQRVSTPQPSNVGNQSHSGYVPDIKQQQQQQSVQVEPKRPDGTFRPPYRSVSDEVNIGLSRVVVLHRSSAGLGFNIVGGEEGEGIFISFILAGGVADQSGQVKRGDKILEVNGVDLRTACHEEAVTALKNAGSTVGLWLWYLPEQYEQFEAKVHSLKSQIMSGSMLRMSEKKSLYVRTLTDYDPVKDDSGLPSRGLAFAFGDVLHVTNASDDDWWQASLVEQPNQLGIIPSHSRWERKLRSRDRSVKWSQNGKLASANGSLLNTTLGRMSRLGPSGGSMKRLFRDSSHDDSTNSGSGSFTELALVQHGPYQLVQLVEIDYARPVVILGPLKDCLNDELINEFPDRFGSCVPHTTRAPRDHEEDGRDYHFVKSRDQMEADIRNHRFVEAGQYNGNLYGTSMESVKEVADEGKLCILDVSGNAIKRLHLARLYPIAIIVKPKSQQPTDSGPSVEVSETDVRLARLEAEFLPYFTAIIECDKFDEAYNRIKPIIFAHAVSRIWITSSESF